MTNIFIGISQNQVDNFQNLIKQLERQNNYNILVTSESVVYDNKVFHKVITAGKTFNNSAQSSAGKLKAIVFKIIHYKQIIKELEPYKKKKELTLYFCYIEDVLTNNLFFFFNKSAKAIVVEDGILNYYNHTLKNVSSSTFFLKRVISLLFGINIRKYKGHSSGIDYKKAICQYVRVPNLSVNPEKSKQLAVKQYKIGAFTNTILLIGQEPLEAVIGEAEYYKRISYILNKMKDLDDYTSVKKVYYKPHRNGKLINKSFLKLQLDNKEIIYLNGDTPIEDIYLSRLKSRYIFGFNTSAAINIYMSLCDKEREKLQVNVFLEKNDTLKEVFTQMKFNILHL